MSITITIAVDSAAQLREQLISLCQLNGVDFEEAASNQRAAEATKPKTPRKAADKPAAEEPKQEEPAAEEQAGDTVPSIDEVKAAAQALVGANGREALAELLEGLGAKNLSSIKESDRAAFIEKCKV